MPASANTGAEAQTGAEPTSVSENSKDGVAKTLERETKYGNGEAYPKFDPQITDESGNIYNLVNSDAPVADPAYHPEKRHYQDQVTIDIPPADINKLEKYFPAQRTIEDGAFVGSIGRAKEPYSVINIYESFTGQVDKQHVIEGLPDNDVVRLPKAMDFEVSSDASMGATTTATLKLLSTRYEVTGTNSLGLPTEYRANLTFRGEQSWLEIHHYNVTAHYEGEVTSSARQYIARAKYELVEEAAPASVETPAPVVSIPAPEVPKAAPSILPYVLTTVAVLLLGLGLFLLWWLLWRKNAMLVRTSDGHKRKVLLRKHLTVVDGQTKFCIPEHIQLLDTASYSVELKLSLASQKGELLVLWGDRLIARALLAEELKLDINKLDSNAMLVAITEAVLEEAVLEEADYA